MPNKTIPYGPAIVRTAQSNTPANINQGMLCIESCFPALIGSLFSLFRLVRNISKIKALMNIETIVIVKRRLDPGKLSEYPVISAKTTSARPVNIKLNPPLSSAERC